MHWQACIHFVPSLDCCNDWVPATIVSYHCRWATESVLIPMHDLVYAAKCIIARQDTGSIHHYSLCRYDYCSSWILMLPLFTSLLHEITAHAHAWKQPSQHAWQRKIDALAHLYLDRNNPAVQLTLSGHLALWQVHASPPQQTVCTGTLAKPAQNLAKKLTIAIHSLAAWRRWH